MTLQIWTVCGLAHSDGIRDGFYQWISHFRDKAKVAYSFIDCDDFPKSDKLSQRVIINWFQCPVPTMVLFN